MMKIKAALFALPFLLLLYGCGAKRAAQYGAGAAEDSAAAEFASAAEWEGGGFNDSLAQSREIPENLEDPRRAAEDVPRPAEKTRKLIKTADVEIRADRSLLDEEGKFFGAAKKVDQLLDRYGAYSERSVIHEDSLSYRIRVPQNSYETMLSGLSVLGKLSSRVERAEDVSLRYYDLEGRLATKKTLLQTFQSYLGRAQTVEDIMSIETRIAELQNEIDWLGTQLAELSNLTDYAVINLSLYSSQAAASYTLGDRIAGLFESFGSFASGALVVILGIILFGVPLVLLILLAFWIFFGRLGLLRKAFRLAAGKPGTDRKGVPEKDLLFVNKRSTTDAVKDSEIKDTKKE
ncbi:MAG: DUF4349 domain-containing protein [Treponema sp.]|jgi:hypothetical protein|nr:DUF4349 domain-containing protein [Treponema sp.]